MRTLTRYFVPAAVLMVVGLVTWTMGRLEQRSTDARKQLLTLVFDGPAAEYDALEQDLRYLRVVPPLGAIDNGVREQRATSRYWRGSYGELAPKTDAAGGVTERDPAPAARRRQRRLPRREHQPERSERGATPRRCAGPVLGCAQARPLAVRCRLQLRIPRQAPRRPHPRPQPETRPAWRARRPRRRCCRRTPSTAARVMCRPAPT